MKQLLLRQQAIQQQPFENQVVVWIQIIILLILMSVHLPHETAHRLFLFVIQSICLLLLLARSLQQEQLWSL